MITCKWLGWRELGHFGGVDAGQDGEKGLNTEIKGVEARRSTDRGKSRALHSSARRPGHVALVQSLADQGFDDRLPADVEFLGEAFQFFEHGGGEINIYTLDRFHHAAGIGEEARDILAAVRHAGDGFGRCRFLLT